MSGEVAGGAAGAYRSRRFGYSAVWLATISVVVVMPPTAVAANAAKTPGPSNSALESAGRRATLKAIDYGEDYCDAEVTVEAWLKTLAGANARAIQWTGGPCVLGDPLNPLDAESWPYCAQATIVLAHPKAKGDRPMIEIYLEEPAHGRPGAAYAFRSEMMTRDDGGDLERSRKDFEREWDERYPPSPTVCPQLRRPPSRSGMSARGLFDEATRRPRGGSAGAGQRYYEPLRHPRAPGTA